MRKTIAASLVALVVVVAQGWADDKADREFIDKAMMGNSMEIKLSEMAAKSASRTEVKEFAQKLVDDHSKAKKQLTDILGKKSIPAPTAEAKNFKEAAEKLSSAKGADFDAAYLEQMVRSHEESIRLYEDYSKNGTDADLKKWATDILPTAKEHLERAKKLAAQK